MQSPVTDEPVSASAIAALRSMDDDGPPVIFTELVQLFIESTPQLLSQACDSLRAPHQLALIAHSLKGSCSNFGAHAMEKLCLDLEQLGRSDQTEGARELIDAIEQEYFRVRVALADHCARGAKMNTSPVPEAERDHGPA
jgi:HPt (histidine-containing phosphotransfer) domain-containing protein